MKAGSAVLAPHVAMIGLSVLVPSGALLKIGRPKTDNDYPHRLPTMHADVINDHLLAFIKS